MNKNYLVVLAIMLAACFSACSDDDDDNKLDLTTTPEYAQFHASQFAAKGDVKTLKLVYSEVEWNEETKTVGAATPYDQSYYEFDQNQFITKHISYNNYAGTSFAPETETSYKYDGDYRVIEAERKDYEYNVANPKVIEYAKIYLQYDGNKNEVTVLEYVGEDGVDYVASEKTIIALDKNGRLDEESAAYEKYFEGLDLEEEDLGRKVKATEWTPSAENKQILHTTTDKKGSTVLSYNLFTYINKHGETEAESTYVTGYFDQAITYYDGTVSSKETEAKTLVGGFYVVPQSSAYVTGQKAKTITESSYLNSKWNNTNETITKGTVSGKHTWSFGNNGGLTEESISETDDEGKLYVSNKTTYKSDDKFRITEKIEISYSADDHDLATTLKETITYDDAAKTATLIINFAENDVEKRVYKLAEDGTIAYNNYEASSPSSLAMSAKTLIPNDKDFEEKWSGLNINKKDSHENWIERYEISRDLDEDEKVVYYVHGHTTRDIVYY